jgi:hypothetical protein
MGQAARERHSPMLLQTDDAGITEADPPAGVIAWPIQPDAALASDIDAVAGEQDGSFPRGLALAVALAVPFWGLAALGMHVVLRLFRG